MTSLPLAIDNVLYSRGKLLQVRDIAEGISVIGFNRRRELCTSVVKNISPAQNSKCAHVWTTKGDAILSWNNRLFTPGGIISVENLHESLKRGYEVNIEIPMLSKEQLTTLFIVETNSPSIEIGSLLRNQELPYNHNDHKIFKIPTASLGKLMLILERSGISVLKKEIGGKWSWIILESLDHHDWISITEFTLTLSKLVSRFSNDNNEFVTPRDQLNLRSLLILNSYFSNTPFKLRGTPTLSPIEVRIDTNGTWHPYARVFSLNEIGCSKMVVQFQDEHFTPLIHNFLIIG